MGIDCLTHGNIKYEYAGGFKMLPSLKQCYDWGGKISSLKEPYLTHNDNQLSYYAT
jgi:hypothetical protein